MTGLEAFVKLAPVLIGFGFLAIFWYAYRKEIRKSLEKLLPNLQSVGPGGVVFAKSSPSEGVRRGVSKTEAESRDVVLKEDQQDKAYPPDYFFINHTSFLIPEKQEEYQRKTGVPVNHYNIHVILDSYYKGALDKVDRVKYFLHKEYEKYGGSIRENKDRANNFLLKELANGEYVLMAEVYLKGETKPITLQRYITLWESGPYITRYMELGSLSVQV